MKTPITVFVNIVKSYYSYLFFHRKQVKMCSEQRRQPIIHQINPWIFTILFSFLNLLNSSYCANINCPIPSQISFEKILGLRPAYNIQINFLYSTRNPLDGIVTECIRRCRLSDQCSSFVLSYSNASCYSLTDEPLGIQDAETLFDTDVAWFRKSCYSSNICNKLWVIERIPAATLVGNNTNRLPTPQTRQKCYENCFNEQSFPCRSAKFRQIPINSITSDYYYPERQSQILGDCVLSNSDRFLSPQSFRVSGYDDEYFENQCNEPVTNEYCAYEEYPDVILTHVDATYYNLTRFQCQRECDDFEAFRCRGFSLIPSFKTTMTSQQYQCLIHSENSKVHGPKSLREYRGAIYYEKAPCLNISVACSHDAMQIDYNTDVAFNGKLYMKGFSESSDCYVLGNKSRHLELRVPLEVNKCGILQVNSPINRTLYATTMVLQYNALVQTQADRIIKVGCIFGNNTENNVVLGTGYYITEDSEHSGSTNINTTFPNQPTVEMKIIDLSANQVGDTEIGDELQLVIEMRPAKSGYDIWAGHLVAMTETGQDSILLLDDRGCPTNLDVFPGMTKIIDDDSIRLTSTFQAFKFSTSNVIRFSVMVQFCQGKCPEVECGGETFYNRVKRKSSLGDNSVAIKSINRTDFITSGDSNQPKIIRMPLEYTLIVRNANTKPDRLVYGENNKILVAGFDYLNNEVCVDYSLLIGLILVWLLIQIILLVSCYMLIRKYKKYYEDQYLSESVEELHKNFALGFSNLDTRRRVHFDDTNVMT